MTSSPLRLLVPVEEVGDVDAAHADFGDLLVGRETVRLEVGHADAAHRVGDDVLGLEPAHVVFLSNPLRELDHVVEREDTGELTVVLGHTMSGMRRCTAT